MTPRVRQYLAQESRSSGVSVGEILSQCRKRPFSYARRRVAVRLRNDGFSYNQIARWLNRKNHTSIIYYMQGAERATVGA